MTNVDTTNRPCPTPPARGTGLLRLGPGVVQGPTELPTAEGAPPPVQPVSTTSPPGRVAGPLSFIFCFIGPKPSSDRDRNILKLFPARPRTSAKFQNEFTNKFFFFSKQKRKQKTRKSYLAVRQQRGALSRLPRRASSGRRRQPWRPAVRTPSRGSRRVEGAPGWSVVWPGLGRRGQPAGQLECASGPRSARRLQPVLAGPRGFRITNCPARGAADRHSGVGLAGAPGGGGGGDPGGPPNGVPGAASYHSQFEVKSGAGRLWRGG